MLMVVTLTGCSVPRGQNGKTYVNSIYTNNDVQVKRGDVDIPDDKELQKKYKDYKADDLITIEKTTFSDAMPKISLQECSALIRKHILKQKKEVRRLRR